MKYDSPEVEKLQDMLSTLRDEKAAMKLVMENVLQVQAEAFQWRTAWKEKYEALRSENFDLRKKLMEKVSDE